MATREAVLVFQPEGVRLPANLSTLEIFREWARSDRFPERGRIDWLEGEVTIDMSPEDLNTHGTPKSAIAAVLVFLIQRARRGAVYVDRARLSHPVADLSAEPDVLVLLFESIRAGLAKLVPKAGGKSGRHVEIEGAADLVVECVSDSSVAEDTTRLPALYHAAGVRELLARRRPSFPVPSGRPRPRPEEVPSSPAESNGLRALRGPRLCGPSRVSRRAGGPRDLRPRGPLPAQRAGIVIAGRTPEIVAAVGRFMTRSRRSVGGCVAVVDHPPSTTGRPSSGSLAR